MTIEEFFQQEANEVLSNYTENKNRTFLIERLGYSKFSDFISAIKSDISTYDASYSEEFNLGELYQLLHSYSLYRGVIHRYISRDCLFNKMAPDNKLYISKAGESEASGL